MNERAGVTFIVKSERIASGIASPSAVFAVGREIATLGPLRVGELECAHPRPGRSRP
jgi:hypothetical protein